MKQAAVEKIIVQSTNRKEFLRYIIVRSVSGACNFDRALFCFDR